MGIATLVEQEGPRSVVRDEHGTYIFVCNDCECSIETDGRRQAEDLLDAHACEDMS